MEKWIRSGFSFDASASNVLLIAFSRSLNSVRFHRRRGGPVTFTFDRTTGEIRSSMSSALERVELYSEFVKVQGHRRRKATATRQRIVVGVSAGSLNHVLFNPLPLTGERNYLPFDVCAPFDPTSTRERLVHNRWNADLWTEIGKVAGRWFTDLLRDGRPTTAWKLLPTRHESAPEDQTTAANVMRQHIVSTPCIRTATGESRPPAYTCYATVPEIRHLLAGEIVSRICGQDVEWVDESVLSGSDNAVAGLRWLGAVEVTLEDVAAVCRLTESLPGTETSEWRVQAATLLAENGYPLGGLRVLMTRGGTFMPVGAGLTVTASTHAGHSTRRDWQAYWQEAVSDLQAAGLLLVSDRRWVAPTADAPLSRGLRQARVEIIPAFGPEHVPQVLSTDRAQPIRAGTGLLNVLAQQLGPAGTGQRLHPRIGENVLVQVFWTDQGGGEVRGWDRPTQAYLPDQFRYMSGSRSPGSRGWGSFASGTPGIKWISTRYLRAVESEGKSEGVRVQRGPQALFSALGALSIFRRRPLGAQCDVELRGGGRAVRRVRETIPASEPYVVERQFEPLDKIYLYETAHGVVDDWDAPDLNAALQHFRRFPEDERRKRGAALLAALVAHWRRLAEYSSAFPASRYYYWRIVPGIECPASWLAQLSQTAWLLSGEGDLERPHDLFWPNPLTLATRPPNELAAVADFDVPLELRQGLGLDDAPPDLDEVLEHLLDAIDTDVSVEQLVPLYEELDRISALGADTVDARHIARKLKNVRSILCADNVWRLPQDVVADGLRGLYGDALGYLHPAMQKYVALWRTLGSLPPTSLKFHARVWSKLSRGQLDRERALQIVTATLRDAVQRGNEDLPRKITLPTIDGGWASARGMTALDDPDAQRVLKENDAIVLEPLWPVWQVRPFLDRCKIHCMERPSKVVPSGSARMLTASEGGQFVRALDAVLAVINRDFPGTWTRAQALANPLRDVPVVLGEATAQWLLRDGTPIDVPVNAVLGPDSILYCRDTLTLTSWNGGGALVALTLQSTDRRRIALEWHVAYEDPEQVPLVTSPLSPASGTSLDGESMRRATGKKFEPGKTATSSKADKNRTVHHLPSVPLVVAAVVDPPHGETSAEDDDQSSGASRESRHRDPGPTQASSSSQSSSRTEYTYTDKEERVRELLETVLGSAKFKDLRLRFGTGADYFEEGSGRPFEIKAWAERADDTVSLTNDQIRTALDYGEDYILVVTEYLKYPDRTRLYLVSNPVGVLTRTFKGQVVLSDFRIRGIQVQFHTADAEHEVVVHPLHSSRSEADKNGQ